MPDLSPARQMGHPEILKLRPGLPAIGERKTHPSEKRRVRHPLNVVCGPKILRC